MDVISSMHEALREADRSFREAWSYEELLIRDFLRILGRPNWEKIHRGVDYFFFIEDPVRLEKVGDYFPVIQKDQVGILLGQSQRHPWSHDLL